MTSHSGKYTWDLEKFQASSKALGLGKIPSFPLFLFGEVHFEKSVDAHMDTGHLMMWWVKRGKLLIDLFEKVSFHWMLKHE